LSGDIIGSLTETTYFRAQLSNGICIPTASDVITVTVIPNVAAGPINSPNNIRLGYTAQLTTAGTAGGTWSSSDTDVATVSETGLVTAVGYGTVDITYTVSSGCGSPVSATVALIINNATTWSGNSWDYGVPDAFVDAIIGGNLTAAEHLVSKTLTINTGIVLTVAADASFTTGDFVNNGTLVVESDGNFVQTEGSINSGSGTATVKRNARMKRLDYTYWGSPVHGSQTLKQFSPGTVDSRFMTYNTIDDTFSTVNPNTTVFVAGKGYAIRASNYYPVWTDPTLESNYRIFEGIFKGQPNNGDINLPLEQTGQTFNLIANPYPSNIDLHALATINNFENKFYFWSNANVGIGGTDYAANNYAVYTGTGGTPAENGNVIPDRYVKVGQGFIVKATTNNLTFTNVMRNNGTGESSFINKGKEAKEVIDRYWLTLASPTSSTNTILIGYPEGATNGYDPEFDAEQLGQSTNSFYSVLEDKKLVIQGRQKPMEVTDVVPLGFKGSAAGQYKISLIKKNGIFEGTQKVYLRDKLNNTITNLHAGNYTFSSQAGIIENRFEIIYVDEILAGNEVKTGELAVYRNGEHFEIKSSQKKISEVEVYDLTGKLIMNVTANQNHVVINSSSWVNGIYLLKIHRNGETVSKKVIK
ncbi:T9SS type A sorting domain-containing protein, partial [Kaistella sp.]|uniref:T9SS type A sorting domain-containing protein n=1 Tax=Kaistella sp. TaxID=2782235 RepID=UPI002F95C8E8